MHKAKNKCREECAITATVPIQNFIAEGSLGMRQEKIFNTSAMIVSVTGP